MTTRNVIGLGLFLMAVAGLHRVLPTVMHPSCLFSATLKQGKAPAGFAGKFAKGDRVRVYERFYVVEHGDELTRIPSEKYEDVVLHRE